MSIIVHDTIFGDYKYKIRIENPTANYWAWLCERVPGNSWKEGMSLIGTNSTYYFKYEEDLLLFKLAHGL